MISLAFPGALSTLPSGINDSGLVVGTYLDAAKVQHGFLYSPDGTFTSFNVPGSTSTTLSGINNLGQMIGTGYGPDALHGLFVYSNGSYKDIFGYNPLSINDSGTILEFGPRGS